MRCARAAVVIAAVACRDGGQPTDDASTDASLDAASDAIDDCANVLPGAPITVGQPLTVASGADAGAGWLWVDFPDAFCGNGTPTGIGVSAMPGSRKVLIYLEGGGACYDATTCFGSAPTAAHMGGYGLTEFGADVFVRGSKGIFDRTDPQNPYRDFHFVFVPYCTGDTHRGNAITSYGAHHVGYANLDAYLKRLVPTFAGKLDQIVLHGSSAGGYGTTWNVWHVANAFQSVPMVYVDDCGPDAAFDGAGVFGGSVTFDQAQQIWGIASTLPPKLVQCGGADNAHLITYLGRAMPIIRGSLIASLQDSAIAPDTGRTGPELETVLRTFAANVAPDNPQFRYFFIQSTQHVWSFNALGSVSSQGVTLATFIGAELAGDATWTSVLPP
jgi:hypothetical protein